MAAAFHRVQAPANLHETVTRTLALQIIRAERSSQPVVFPNEAELCEQLGVSRSVLREAVKVLADKGMIEVRPRSGTRAQPRHEWHLLDPDILSWQSELAPDARFLRDLCEVRLAFEPTASGFAALRATPHEVSAIQASIERREAGLRVVPVEQAVDFDLQIQIAVVAASHNTLFQQLSNVIRQPFRTTLAYTVRLPASVKLETEEYRALFEAIRDRDPLAARAASDKIVGLAMIAVEQVIRSMEKTL